MIFENKKIFILGMARSGYEAAKLLSRYTSEILLYDDKKEQEEEHVQELRKLGVNIVFEGKPDDILTGDYDYLVKNPGVPLDHFYLKEALKYGIPIVNEVEIAYRLMPHGIKIIGITGTNGKTTTTTLIYEILKEAGMPVHLTGNIGFPLCSFIDKIKTDDIVVMEVSVQQLVNTKNFKTNISVMTNLSEAHIDFVNSYDNYKKIKYKIFDNHTSDDIAILNRADDTIMEITKDIKSYKKYFSSKEKTRGAYLKDNTIYYNAEKIIETCHVRILGVHNYENIMAAVMVVKELNVNNDIIRKILKKFSGVEHRQEYVAKINGVEFYNDSKATNNKATQIALSSFNKPVVLVMGGLDRGQSFNELSDYMSFVKLIICYGETRNNIKKFANDMKIDCIVVNNLEEAVKSSYNLSTEGDVVLLSPACASWDQFKNFEARGELFKEYVNNLE